MLSPNGDQSSMGTSTITLEESVRVDWLPIPPLLAATTCRVAAVCLATRLHVQPADSALVLRYANSLSEQLRGDVCHYPTGLAYLYMHRPLTGPVR